MVEDKRFRQLERRTYLLYHQDGLVDIIIGLCVIGFAVNMLTDSSALSILAWMPVILLPGLKNRITVPRLGFARFDPKRTGSLRLLTMMLILGLVVLLGGVLVYLGARSDSPDLRAWLRAYHMPALAAIAALVLLLAGWLSGVKRLYAYATLTLVVIAGGTWLAVDPPLSVLLLGGLILTSGLVILARFLRKYPLNKSEGLDDAA